jgi:hypothetical protein
MAESGAQASAPSPTTVRKVALAAMTGSAIEWYDFFIGHDVRAAGRAIRRDVQRQGTLLGGFDRLPGRLCLRRGLAPIIMVWLLDTTGTSLSVSFYAFVMSAITFFSVYLITETYEGEMTQDQERGTEEEPATT